MSETDSRGSKADADGEGLSVAYVVKVAIVTVVAVIAAVVDLWWASFVALLGLLTALGSAGRAILPIRQPQHLRIQRSVVLLASIIAVLVGVGSCKYKTKRLEQHVAPIIAAIELYRGEKGEYPDKLKALIPRYVSTLPDCPTMRGLFYARYTEDVAEPFFVVGCITYGFNHHDYDSRLGDWKDWD